MVCPLAVKDPWNRLDAPVFFSHGGFSPPCFRFQAIGPFKQSAALDPEPDTGDICFGGELS
jgi:hypothetical protein